ncbi:MAG: flagellar basal body P-ring formation protein FlgA [Deltaproteobacteria bacterium]|nr:flagellar basal body P-ring formation protein FlgA [Deltaproteobacteria bacterium]
MKRVVAIALFAVVTTLVGTATIASAAELAVRERIEAHGDRVLLGDLILAGLPAELADVFVAKAPPLGDERVLTGSFIAGRIRQAGGRDLAVRIPAQVVISSPAQTISADALRAEIETQLRQLAGDPNLPVKFPAKVRDALVPPGDVTIRCEWPDGVPVAGRRPATVRIAGAGFEKKMMIDVEIDTPQQVVVAKNAIPKGRAVTSDDIRIEPVSAKRVRGRVARSPDMVVGRVARRAVANGETLREDALTTAAVIRRGDVVKLQVVSQGVQLTAFAVAQREGREGETIDVRNMDSGVIVKARVRDAHTVTVEL